VSLPGFFPCDESTREFWIEKDLIQLFYKRGWMDKYKALHCVKEVLKSPGVIFERLNREGQEEALCYAGLASCRYSRNGNQLSPPPGMTFAVYIRKDDVVFRWDWEQADQNLVYPLGFRERFGPQLWPKT